MLFIHGGGFTSGSASEFGYEGDYLAAFGEVVVVTTNYRLGAFGFLYGGGEDESGNLGLFDQLLALKWLRDNIEAFGGDSKQVTIFGESAGSMSVSGHIVSPLSKGLFHRAISESGAIYGGPPFGQPAKALESETLAFAQKLNCSHENELNFVMDCLRAKPAEEVQAINQLTLTSSLAYESGFEGEFFPQNPNDAVKAGNFNSEVDYLYGVTDDEGAFILYLQSPEDFDPVNHLPMNLTKAKSIIADYMPFFGHPENAEKAVEYYLKGVNTSSEDALLEAVSQAFGDGLLVCPTVRFGQQVALQSQNASTYSYRLIRKANVFRYVFNCKGWMGICHGEELISVFAWPFYEYFNKEWYSEEDRRFSRQLIKAWTTFAKTGAMPAMGGQKWEESLDKEANVRYMQLNLNNYKMVEDQYTYNCDKIYN